MACLDPQVVHWAAEEMGIENSDRVELVASSHGRDGFLESLVLALATEAGAGTYPGQHLIVQSLASAFAVWLLTRYNARQPRDSRLPGALGGPTFGRVRAYIEANLGQHMSLDDLAAVAHVSRFHFARQFRLRTGESPMGYVLRARIERAKEMLRSRSTTVSDAAAALGFADQSHFTRTFHRIVGVAPREFMRSALRSLGAMSLGQQPSRERARNDEHAGSHEGTPLQALGRLGA